MADIPSVQEIETKAIEAYKKIQEGANAITFKKISDQFKEITISISKFGDTAANLRNNTLQINSGFDSMAKSLSTVLALTTKFDAFKGMQVSSGHVVETMGSQFDSLIGRFGGWEKATQKLVGAGLSNIVSMGPEIAKAFLESASSAQHLESSYLNLQAATGNLGKVFDASNNVVHDLGARVAEYGTLLADTSAITHENIKVVSEFSTKLGSIPNILGVMIDQGTGADNALEGMAATMTVAKGAGRGLDDVLSSMKIAYENLGNPQGQVTDNAKKGIEMFSLMSEASSKLGLRFSDTEGFLAHVADQFKHVGDNTQGATNILARFSGALQSTGLTAKQSIDVVQGMIDSIRGLEMGTKALLSIRSGGPGGLQGAFQIENLMRQGKTDEVAKMLESSFKKQVGGRIFTQEEAGQSPQAAAQFMRQRTMLQSGAFGGLAKDNESATRLLEAMAKGPTETAKSILDASAAAKDVTSKGNELQKTQVNLLDMINNSLDRSITIQEQTFLATAREAIGAGKQGTAWAEALENFRMTAQKDASQISTNKEALPISTQQERQNRISGASTIDAFGVGAPNVAELGKEFIENSMKSAREGVSKFQSTMGDNKSAAMARAGQDATARAISRGSINAATQAAMRESPQKLGTQLPKATEIMKHEVSVEPLKIDINVKSDEGLKIETTTNRPQKNLTITNINRTAQNGNVNKSEY